MWIINFLTPEELKVWRTVVAKAENKLRGQTFALSDPFINILAFFFISKGNIAVFIKDYYFTGCIKLWQ